REARELDQGRGQDYWTTEHEMLARAFSAYIEDRARERGVVSEFLTYSPEQAAIPTPWGPKRPFPFGAERKAINEAFDNLFRVIEARQADDGTVGFYSIPAPTTAARQPLDLPRIRAAAQAAESEYGIRINVVPNTSDPSVPERIRGTNPQAQGYTDGHQAWVFTDNIYSFAHAQAVIAHEVVGHVGVEPLVEPEEWANIIDTVRGVLDGSIGAVPNANAANRAAALGPNRPEAVSDEVARIIREARDRYADASDTTLAREVVAIMAERGVKASMLDRLLAAMRRALRRVFKRIAWSDAELRDLLVRSAEGLRRTREAGDGVAPRLEPDGAMAQGALDPDKRDPGNPAPYIADLLRRYDEQDGDENEWMSPEDVMDELEGIVVDSDSVPGLDAVASAIEDARSEMEEDAEEWGLRGDSGDAVEAVIDAARAFVARSQRGGFAQGAPSRITDTQEFRRWFGDSKVVDEQGKPLVVYHATASDFSIFKPGGNDPSLSGLAIWMTPNKREQPAAHNINRNLAVGRFVSGARVLPLYASINRPLVSTDATWKSDFAQFGGSPWTLTEQQVANLKAAGHDGVMHYKNGKLVEVVAFDPTQIKSAIGNVGSFDPTNPDIRFAQGAPDPDAILRADRNTEDGARATLGAVDAAAKRARRGGSRIRDALETWRGGEGWSWLNLLGRTQLVEVGKAAVPRAVEFGRLADRMDAAMNKLMEPAAEVAERWAKLVSRDSGAASRLARIMHRATVEQFDPDKQTPAANDGRPFPGSLVQRRLKADFDSLPDEAKAVYRDVRDSYKARSNALMAALIDRINIAMQDGRARAEAIAKVRAHFEGVTLAGPYFPLSRFGDLWIRARKPGGEVEYILRETVGQWRQTMADLEAEGYVIEASGKKIRELHADPGPGGGFMTDIIGILDKAAGGDDLAPMIDEQAASALKDEFWQLYLQSLPELSLRKHSIHRSGTPGYSEDALRAYAHHMSHGARQIARLQYGHRMARELVKARDEANQSPDPVKAADVIKALDSSYQWQMNPTGGRTASMLT
ncbi:MAG: hypothetical protein RLZZ524_797, partial [Pseudomonadota bacterium]